MQEREHTVHAHDKTMAERCRMKERKENIRPSGQTIRASVGQQMVLD